MDVKNASLIFVSEKLKINEICLIINFLITFLDTIKKMRTAKQINKLIRSSNYYES